jgi:hypothetical protein
MKEFHSWTGQDTHVIRKLHAIQCRYKKCMYKKSLNQNERGFKSKVPVQIYDQRSN